MWRLKVWPVGEGPEKENSVSFIVLNNLIEYVNGDSMERPICAVYRVDQWDDGGGGEG